MNNEVIIKRKVGRPRKIPLVEEIGEGVLPPADKKAQLQLHVNIHDVDTTAPTYLSNS